MWLCEDCLWFLMTLNVTNVVWKLVEMQCCHFFLPLQCEIVMYICQPQMHRMHQERVGHPIPMSVSTVFVRILITKCHPWRRFSACISHMFHLSGVHRMFCCTWTPRVCGRVMIILPFFFLYNLSSEYK